MTATAVRARPPSRPVVGTDRLPGADAFTLDRHAVMRPDGDVHLVDAGWEPACGAGRVRYVFPGRPADTSARWCPRCVSATSTARVPRQRKAR